MARMSPRSRGQQCPRAISHQAADRARGGARDDARDEADGHARLGVAGARFVGAPGDASRALLIAAPGVLARVDQASRPVAIHSPAQVIGYGDEPFPDLLFPP